MKKVQTRLQKVKKTRQIKAVARDDPGLVLVKQGNVELVMLRGPFMTVTTHQTTSD